jgi:hypothetical protein
LLSGNKGEKLVKKLNNYCFKCLSTELLLLGGSDIFCSVCHLVFSDKETLDYLQFHKENPVNSKYYKMGSWNFGNMLEVFYGWIQRIHLVFSVELFHIDIKYLIHQDSYPEPLVYQETNWACTNTNVIEKLYEHTLNEEFNKEHFEFIGKTTGDDEWRTIEFTVSAFFRDKKYPVARFHVIQENYENNNLHFEDWDLLTVGDTFKGSYYDLKIASQK